MTQPFSTGKQRVLLRLTEAVDLVEEEHGGEAIEVAVGQCLLHGLAHVGHTGVDGGQLHEVTTGAVGDRLGQGGFARPGWTPENDGHGALPSGHVRGKTHQRGTRGEKVALAGDLIETRGPHPYGEGSRSAA
jgi:hypothetical protein